MRLKFDSFAKCKQKKFESKKLINSIVVLTSALGSKVPWVAFGLDNASKQIKMNFSNSKFIKTISKRFQIEFLNGRRIMIEDVESLEIVGCQPFDIQSLKGAS